MDTNSCQKRNVGIIKRKSPYILLINLLSTSFPNGFSTKKKKKKIPIHILHDQLENGNVELLNPS